MRTACKKAPHAVDLRNKQFTCNTDKFIYTANSSRKIQVNCMQPHVNLNQCFGYFRGTLILLKFARDENAKLTSFAGIALQRTLKPLEKALFSNTNLTLN